jgi:hypothetical protein
MIYFKNIWWNKFNDNKQNNKKKFNDNKKSDEINYS